MPFGRFLVQILGPTEKAEDVITNTLYFNIGIDGNPVDWDQLATDIAAVWRTTLPNNCAGRDVIVTAYDMADAKPRPQKAKKINASTGGTMPNTPAQVSLCLSYYVDRNLPRFRGRIYVGPWPSTAARPTDPQMTTLQNLANALGGIGGLNVDWSLYSPTRDAHERINHWWVDDSWDIIRSRKLASTKRIAGSLNG